MYINLITQILNAQKVNKENVKFLCSKMDEGVLKVMKRYEFIEEFSKKGKGIKKYFDIKLKYKDNNKGKIKGARFISKPSRRLYSSYKDIESVRQGYGISVISSSKGIISGDDARKEKIGGEILFKIW